MALSHNGWTEKDHRLVRTYRFADFADAFAFVARVAQLAEQHRHHPSILLEYGLVRLELTTHDAGNRITEKDHALAEAILEL